MQAKILQHAEGLGTPSPELVRRRAREIATIDGRAEYSDGDWAQAKRELHGGHDFSADGEDEQAAGVSGRDMVAGSIGHHVANSRDESEFAVEELVAEGMDEAVHEQMLEARRLEDTEDSAES